MTRLRQNLQFGVVSDNPLTIGATTLNSAALATLVTVAGSDDLLITLDPAALAGAPEIVRVTAHAGAATSCTISRGFDGTTARQHIAGTAWVHADYAEDFIVQCTSLTRPAVGLYIGEFAFETDTSRLIRWNGTAWVAVVDAFIVDTGWFIYS